MPTHFYDGYSGGLPVPEERLYQSLPNRDRLVHIVDPDLQTCESLSVLFRLEGYQTLFPINLGGFLASLERRMPDAVIVNFDLGRDDGLELLHRINIVRFGTPVFMIENHRMVEAAVRAIKAGAADVVTKPIDTDHLVRSLDEALRPGNRSGQPASPNRKIDAHGFAQLTPREREVLQLITNGESNTEAGRHLGISPRTIEVHRARVMEKLGARNTADLMRIVLTS